MAGAASRGIALEEAEVHGPRQRVELGLDALNEERRCEESKRVEVLHHLCTMTKSQRLARHSSSRNSHLTWAKGDQRTDKGNALHLLGSLFGDPADEDLSSRVSSSGGCRFDVSMMFERTMLQV